MGVQINGSEGNVIATKGTYSGNVTIGGTLTYEDVTNIDSVGLITARSGIEIGARPGVGASISVDGNAIFSGITTSTTFIGNLTGNVTGDVTGTASQVTIASGADNRVLTAASANTIQGEANLTYNGTLLTATGSNEADIFQLSTGNGSSDTFAGFRCDNRSGIRIRGGGSQRGGEIDLGGGQRASDPAVIKFSTTTGTSFTERLRIDSSGNLLIGDSAGQIGKLSTLGTGNHISAIRHSTDTSSANVLFAKYRGSRSSPAIIVSGDTLGDLAWYGYNGSSIIKAASVSAAASSTVDGSNMPTDLIFKTTAGNTNSEKLRIKSNGYITEAFKPVKTAQDTNLASTSGDRFQIDLPSTSRMYRITGSFSFNGGIYRIWGDYGGWTDGHTPQLEGFANWWDDNQGGPTYQDVTSSQYFEVADPVDSNFEVTYDILLTTMAHNGTARPGVSGNISWTYNGVGRAWTVFSYQDTAASGTDRKQYWAWDIDIVSGTLGTGQHQYVIEQYPLTQ